MNIMVASRGLCVGGIGRVAADLSRGWAEEGHDVTLVTLIDESTDAYPLHPRVRRVALGCTPLGTVRQLFRRTHLYRREIRQTNPQVVVGLGADSGLLLGIAALGLPCRSVVCEFGVPWRNPMRRPGREWVRRRAYRVADAVTSESASVDSWLERSTWARRTVVIPKSVQWPLPANGHGVSPEVACAPHRKIVLAAGRLVPVKGFDSLLRAFASVAAERPDWDLVILGDGPCRGDLESQIATPGLAGRALLPGTSGCLGAWYRRASIFAISSLHEGGPNVLIEALAHGVPAISYDCDEGPRTILRDKVDGLLVPPGDEDLFAAGLARLMDDPALRVRMAGRATEARERFSEQNSLRHWNRLFHEIGAA